MMRLNIQPRNTSESSSGVFQGPTNNVGYVSPVVHGRIEEEELS
jgi:hypothetical protein